MPTISSIFRRARRSVVFGILGRRRAFSHIFQTRYWGDDESVSGWGSSLAQTESIRFELPRIIERFKIGSMIDAPCGDLYWMSMVLDKLNIDYVGGDIVEEVVNIARSRTNNRRAHFVQFDIVESTFPPCDLWLCRDVLFHLSFQDIGKALDNFMRSEVEYLLVTSHSGEGIANRNIVTGDFRKLNLFKEPFGFPEDKVLYRFDDYVGAAPPREMLLFHRKDLLGLDLI